MKKHIYLFSALALATSFATAAFAQDISGTITKVRGDKVTIEISKADAATLAEGDQATVTVKVTPKTTSAPAAGNDMLTGC